MMERSEDSGSGCFLFDQHNWNGRMGEKLKQEVDGRLIKIRFKINRMKKIRKEVGMDTGTTMQWMAAKDTEEIYLFNVFSSFNYYLFIGDTGCLEEETGCVRV